MQEGPPLFVASIGYSPESGPPGEGGSPSLSTCTLPRVQRVVKRIDSVRQRSNFRPLLAPAWRQTHVAPLPAPEVANRSRVATHGVAPPSRCSTTPAQPSRGSPGSEGYCPWINKTGGRLPSKSQNLSQRGYGPSQ